MAGPIVKYVGGKRDHGVIDSLLTLMRTGCYNAYVEPFLGGASVLCALDEAGMLTGRRAFVGDADRDLIRLYLDVAERPEHVLRIANKEADIVAGCATERERKQMFHVVRDLWNIGPKKGGTQLYLRHAVYNGLFRRSKDGHLNTSARDGLSQIALPLITDLQAFGALISRVTLLDWDFRQYEADLFIGPGTLVYLDPPYLGTFEAYTAAGFTAEDHVELLILAAEWARRGATVVYSNADTPMMRALLEQYWPRAFQDANVEFARRSISCDGDRERKAELLIVQGHDVPKDFDHGADRPRRRKRTSRSNTYSDHDSDDGNAAPAEKST